MPTGTNGLWGEGHETLNCGGHEVKGQGHTTEVGHTNSFWQNTSKTTNIKRTVKHFYYLDFTPDYMFFLSKVTDKILEAI